MVRTDWGCTRAFSLILLSTLAVGTACSNQERAAAPTVPSTLPTPAPTPVPTPVPSPTPQASESGMTLVVFQYPKQSHCKRGVGPTGTEDLRVGCSIEVDAQVRDANGIPVNPKHLGTDLRWHIPEGASNITLPWDENPWKRWMTGIAPGPYRIEVTIHFRDGDQATGMMSGQIVP